MKNIFEIIVGNIVKRRLCQHYNAMYLKWDDFTDDMLIQCSNEVKNLLLKTKAVNNTEEGFDLATHEIGYKDGLHYANRLIKENSFNLECLWNVVKQLPNSHACIVFGTMYSTGFFNGLFGGNDYNDYTIRNIDSNYFIKKWKKILIKKFSTEF